MARAEGGDDQIDNAIPVCFDCHAEIESAGPRGRRFSQNELREHKRHWLRIVESSPASLIQAARQDSQTGPLEALCAELGYNDRIVQGPLDQGFPPLATKQFDRAVASNALDSLAEGTRQAVLDVYVRANLINYHLHSLALMDRGGGSGGAWAATQSVVRDIRVELRNSIGAVLAAVLGVLGQGHDEPAGT